MRTLPLAVLAVFPLLSSCGAGDGADGATRGVSGETQLVPPTATPEATPEGALGDDARTSPPVFDGFVGARFAILEAEGHTRIVDLVTRRVVVVAGHPIVDEQYGGDLTQFSIPPSVPTRTPRATKDGRRLAIVDGDGAYAVDTTTGARVASLMGTAEGAALGDDGSVLVSWGGGAMRFGDVDGTWTANVTLTSDREPVFFWHGRLVVVHTVSGEHVVDRSTWTEWRVPEGELVRVTEDGVAITRADDTIALWRVGEDAPPERFTGVPASVYVHVDAAHVAWGERTAATETDERLTFHVVSRTTRARTTFRGEGTCPIQPESVQSIADGEITTDVTCNPGCASIEYQTHHVVYDAATGALKRREHGELSPALTLTWGATLERLEVQAHRLGATRESAVESPGAPGVFAFTTETELLLGDGVRGRVLRAMKRSEGAAHPVFTKDGRFVAATTEGGAFTAWDARTGEPVFSTDTPE